MLGLLGEPATVNEIAEASARFHHKGFDALPINTDLILFANLDDPPG
jgi:hypothetical protein